MAKRPTKAKAAPPAAGGPFDPLAYAKEKRRAADPDTRWFEVDPGRMYPAALDAMKAAPDAKALALTARADVAPGKAAARAALLERARLWFTARLHEAVGKKPMGVHILKDDRWKL